MFTIETKEEYEFTKGCLTMFCKIVRKQQEVHTGNKEKLLNSGYISQIKEFVQQLRLYRKNHHANKSK